MRIPYVIDNVNNRLVDVLNDLLEQQPGQQMDIATAYFSVCGFEHLRDTLPNLRHFRLLLGDNLQQPGDVVCGPTLKPSCVAATLRCACTSATS